MIKHFVYVSSLNPEEGQHSFHLMTNGSSYFNNEKTFYKLDDGSQIEYKTYFVKEILDIENKTFTGYVEHTTSPIYSAVRRDFLMQFSDNWQKILQIGQKFTADDRHVWNTSKGPIDFEHGCAAWFLREELFEDTAAGIAAP